MSLIVIIISFPDARASELIIITSTEAQALFLQMGGGKKHRERKSKQVKKQDEQVPFKLSMDTFAQFALIDLVPPTSLEEVSKSVKELIAKKEWYAKQPRGSVPTAKEIHKANESAAAKLRSTAEEVAGKETNQTKKKQGTSEFSLKSDDFVPLGTPRCLLIQLGGRTLQLRKLLSK